MSHITRTIKEGYLPGALFEVKFRWQLRLHDV